MRAQAAMEFLMTYGWAILVVLVAVGALAYFGVLSPDRFLPERCTGPAGFDCVSKAGVNSISGNIILPLKNNNGYRIDIGDSINTTPDCLNPDITDINGLGPPPLPAPIGNNEDVLVTISCTGGMTPNRGKVEATLQYTNAETGLTHNAIVSVTYAS